MMRVRYKRAEHRLVELHAQAMFFALTPIDTSVWLPIFVSRYEVGCVRRALKRKVR